MAKSRRDFLRLGFGTAAAGLVARTAGAAPQHEGHTMPPDMKMPAPAPTVPQKKEKKARPARQSAGGLPYVPVEVPDVPKLEWTMDNGVKVFHLIPEVVDQAFVPWKVAKVWGFNGSSPGPTIEVVEGDRVRIVVENRLPEATTMHWHGLEVPNEMDGVEGIVQDFIAPGGKFTYEFTLHQNGTFFYHSHRPMQQMMGLIGLFIVHPRRPYEPRVDRDFAWVLQEWATLPNNPVPNSMAMEFNWLTMNGKAAPATTPVLVKRGERVRFRFVNLGMDHHPIHFHGHTWQVTGTEGGRIPKSAWKPGNTELIGVAQARDLEFIAHNPGDWMIHCHLPHHMMNAMVSMVGPMSEPAGGGVPTGGSMNEGMGMIGTGGHALREDMGPVMGRTIGADSHQQVSSMVGPNSQPSGQAMEHQHGEHSGHSTGPALVAPDARQVPGYPQDMFMVMDEPFRKPETYGLRPSWTGAMMGMMTLFRVLKPEMFDRIMEMKEHEGGGR
jgi:FtsP/CotA-like multicopper oxidase with cupredoxin domain